MSSFITLALLPFKALAAPFKEYIEVQPRVIQSIGSIDPSTDEWSSTLSGIGPLILLIGERTTKQVLRNVRGISTAFSLAAAPLGLLTVCTSLIRFCGTQRLRAFIGYELEARTVAGIDVTRVNCGGVTAHLSDGYVVRSIVNNPSSQLMAVSILEGTQKGVETKALARIMESERFSERKKLLGVPAGEANVEWCLHINVVDMNEEVLKRVVQVLANAVGLDISSKEVAQFIEILGSEISNSPISWVCAFRASGNPKLSKLQIFIEIITKIEPTTPPLDFQNKKSFEILIKHKEAIR